MILYLHLMIRTLSLLLALLSFVVSQAQPYKKELRALDAYCSQALVDWNVPGMAVAIVKDGVVIFEKGYGVRNTDDQTLVDAHTAFAIASNTKSVTAAALAMLVDEGRLNWDDEVQKHLPYFQLYNPYVSVNLTVRDLLCHRSGLATFSGDLIWYGSTYSRREVLDRARFLKPVSGFRAKYGYQNIMFLAAGEVIPAVADTSWDDFVKDRILTPLGMNNTYLSTSDLRRETNVASPHNEINGKNRVVNWVNWDNIAPAGSIITSVHDWSKYILLQLGQGSLNGTTYWSEQRTREMWSMHTAETISESRERLYPTMTFAGYGLGWQLQSIYGKKVVSHGGGYDGMVSRTLMVPSEQLGMIVVTNSNTILSYAITNRILEIMLGEKNPTDWSKKFLELTRPNSEVSEDDSLKVNGIKPVAGTSLSLPLEAYAGTYSDPMYGEIELRIVADQLAFQFVPTPIFRGTLRHFHYDTFELNWGTVMMLPSGLARFVVGYDGKISELHIDVQNPDFDFTEILFKKLD